MTESEWLACADPRAMLTFVRGGVGDRKLRLFACACVRAIWGRLAYTRSGELSRRAVEASERYADGRATAAELAGARGASGWIPVPAAQEAAGADAWHAAWYTPFFIVGPAGAHAAVLREILGNPFRRATLDRSWLTWHDGAVRKMAQTIYDDGRFGDLPILADALEDAGCANADVLSHCRGGGEHVRGCWVVDLLLGKE